VGIGPVHTALLLADSDGAHVHCLYELAGRCPCMYALLLQRAVRNECCRMYDIDVIDVIYNI
jgi:hypothetical protein